MLNDCFAIVSVTLFYTQLNMIIRKQKNAAAAVFRVSSQFHDKFNSKANHLKYREKP